MKKIVLLSIVLCMAVSTAVWAGPFEQYYDYRNDEGTYSYYFTDGSPDQGIFVTMDLAPFTSFQRVRVASRRLLVSSSFHVL